MLAPPAEAEADTAAADDDRADWTVMDRLEHPEDYEQLWVVAVARDGPAPAEPVQLTRAPLHPSHVAWSPDGATLALTYNERFSTLVDEEQRVGLIPADGGEIALVSDPDRHASLAAFSPDGKRLAYFMDRADALRSYLNLKSLFVRDLATGAERDLAPSAQSCLSGSGSTPEDPRSGRATAAGSPCGWGGPGHQPVARRRAAGRPAAADLVRRQRHRAGPGRRRRRLRGERAAPARLGARRRGRQAGVHAHARERRRRGRRLRPGRAAAPGPARPRRRRGGGLPVPAAGQDRRRRPVPLRHGDARRPVRALRQRLDDALPWQVLSRRGYAVFIANPRGSTAYGEAFQRGVYRNFGTDDHLDLMAACDELVARGIADPARLGFTGYSYGGLTTNNVISRTDRFKAAVSIAGIFNYVSAMGQNNPQLFIDGYDRPWDGDLQRMWEHSPPRGRRHRHPDPGDARAGRRTGRPAPVRRAVHLPAAQRRAQPAGALPGRGARHQQAEPHARLPDAGAGLVRPLPARGSRGAGSGAAHPRRGLRPTRFFPG
ncbi:MAG: prolyl oligopeptidase family serine peptidase [bacterium]|nr:prolyl oligopeptidase family serine peptidase [bacterium]